jgi:hypothetical protein
MQYAAAVLVAVYLACAFAAASADGLTGVDVWYLIAASVTTVWNTLGILVSLVFYPCGAELA